MRKRHTCCVYSVSVIKGRMIPGSWMKKGGRTPTAPRQASRRDKRRSLASFVIRQQHDSDRCAAVFHNLIRLNYAPFFASCRRHRVLTVTCNFRFISQLPASGHDVSHRVNIFFSRNSNVPRSPTEFNS
jgi:hypothetical protein